MVEEENYLLAAVPGIARILSNMGNKGSTSIRRVDPLLFQVVQSFEKGAGPTCL